MKIVVLDGYTLNPGDLSWSELEKIGTVEIYDRTQEIDIAERIAGAEIVLTNKTPLSRSIIESADSLRYIGVLATGFNVIDIEAAREKDVVVCNIPTYGTTAVSQYVFALLLEFCHHVGVHNDSVKQGEWSENPDFCYWKHPLIELDGKTMGIIGYGRIGKGTANIAKAFGMNVLVYDAYQMSDSNSETVSYVDLETLYRDSDVISLHCPLTAATQNMINKEAINKMKPNVIIVNTSRGPLVNEADLADALNNNQIGGYACDVVSQEPILANNPLLSSKNTIVTPHIAWAPIESRQRLLQIAVDNIHCYIKGSLRNVVN